jgi:hypothetical protein
MMRTFLTLLLAAAGGDALAAGFQDKTMKESLSAREVQRGLLMPKGWMEFGVGADVKMAEGSWTADGDSKDFAEGVDWLYTTERFDVRYGIARRAELYWRVKTHYVQLTNEDLGTDMSQFGLGDPNFGMKYELYSHDAPVRSWILQADYKGPAANEAPGNYVGGPYTFSSFVLTTGTPDLTLGTRYRQQVGPAALTVGAAYMYRFSGIVQYVIETELNQFSGRIKPGDVVKADAELTVQAGPIALSGGAIWTSRQATRKGNTSDSVFQAKDLEAVEGSEGSALDAMAGLTFHAGNKVDLVLGANIPLKGEDLQFFPIEDIHPTRGNTYSGTVEFRY